MQGPSDFEADGVWGGEMMNPESAAAVWRERERRQRTIRLLMMFLVMLLLMDGEEGAQRRQQHALLKRKKREPSRLEATVFEARQRQELRIRGIVQQHARYKALMEDNGEEDVDEIVVRWAEDHADQEKDQFAEGAAQIKSHDLEKDPEEERRVFHYPWNATGFYRGEWSREKTDSQSEAETETKKEDEKKELPTEVSASTAKALEQPMLKVLEEKEDKFGVFILPDGMRIEVRNDNNLTSMNWEDLRTDKNNAIVYTEKKTDAPKEKPSITLVHDSGRAAFQFFSRTIPSMKELSFVDGFVKIYDSTSPGYSTRKDILLRVRGVLIHAIGRISLVSNVDVSRSALVIGGEQSTQDRATQHRRLEEALANVREANVEQIRDHAISLFADSSSLGKPRALAFSSPELAHRRLDEEEHKRETIETEAQNVQESTEEVSKEGKNSNSSISEPSQQSPSYWSDIMLPYPFVMDDKKETVRRIKTPASRVMPLREQPLEENAAGCGFEITLDVGKEEWTVGEWRKVVSRKIAERKRLNPALQGEVEAEEEEAVISLRGSRVKPIQDLALVMTMVGTIRSSDCDFSAAVNATALRTDWEATTSKAINYSFLMMLVCLTQILILLRQLLHSQGNSAATRVSLLCIGWQTLIDALMCMAHIYMSLSIQPLFSAFASVSFFKLLIFCVIEMKYMAIIIQARNSSNGGQTAEVLRRQIAMLHLRFYTAMAGSFLLLLYAGDKYRVFSILSLYSFWVPQIVLNVVTEAKSPMHHYFVYGMSLTRLIAPLYLLSIKDNFLKEVYPEAPYDPFTCQMLVLWVGVQTAVLIGQSKYGARFMIPARFLPPKFDYSRPIPASMLPPGVPELPASESIEDRGDDSPKRSERQALLGSTTEVAPRGRRHTTAVTTRNRIRRTVRSESGMVADAPAPVPPLASTSPVSPTLDCSICYDAIDIRKRHDYMLAPCNHLFHRECLVQWMDIKMECPICRTELPAL